MNRKIYWSTLCVIFIMALGACGGSGTKTPPPVEGIAVQSGSGQSTVVSTPFGAQLVALVSTGGTPNSGVVVTFTAPSSGASGTFATSSGGSLTATATTGANGQATSPVFTANATVGGPYTVTAAAAGVTATAGFSLTNTAVVVTSSQFSFYVTGLENFTQSEQDPFFYTLAGTVTIGSDGSVLGGEQDYNDAAGFTSPQPSGDSITGGALVEDPTTGQGTLTLITNNADLGLSGTETLGVQFVNASHALLIQFDSSATSSGSLDLQTLPSTLSGGYAFTLTGVDPVYESVVLGGVFSVSGTALTNGIVDVNDEDVGVTPGTAFTGTVNAPDAFGRGTITASTLAATINYYIIGPEAIRIIDMDLDDTFIGSAFGQGTAGGTFANSSLGPADVFSIASNSWGDLFSTVGQFTTSVATVKPKVHKEGIPENDFSGTADDDEFDFGEVVSAATISGFYGIGTNGYGFMEIGAGDLGDVSSLGIYMVDPAINISDPNNTTGGGGALVADLDFELDGTGVIVPQTDPATASFTGNYAFGAQAFNFFSDLGWEFDFIGQGNFTTDGVLTGTGLLNDPFLTLTTSSEDSGVTFSGTAVPDLENPGRYTMFDEDALLITLNSTSPSDQVVIYQASGAQLFWMQLDFEDNNMFSGSLEQQSLPTPAVKKKAAANTKLNLKPKPKG